MNSHVLKTTPYEKLVQRLPCRVVQVSTGYFKELNMHPSMFEYTTFKHSIILPSLPAVNSCCMLSRIKAAHIKLCKHENMNAQMQVLKQTCTQTHIFTTPHLPPASFQFWHHCPSPGIHWRRGGLWIHMWLLSEAVVQRCCPPQGYALQIQPNHSSAVPPLTACTSLCSPGCTVTAAPPIQRNGNSKGSVSLSWLVGFWFTMEHDRKIVCGITGKQWTEVINQAIYGIRC